MFGKKLITQQTGPEGKIVKRIYIEEISEIKKELYLACIIDRATAKIACALSLSDAEGQTD